MAERRSASAGVGQRFEGLSGSKEGQDREAGDDEEAFFGFESQGQPHAAHAGVPGAEPDATRAAESAEQRSRSFQRIIIRAKVSISQRLDNDEQQIHRLGAPSCPNSKDEQP